MLAAGPYTLLRVAGAFQRGHFGFWVDGAYTYVLSMFLLYCDVCGTENRQAEISYKYVSIDQSR